MAKEVRRAEAETATGVAAPPQARAPAPPPDPPSTSASRQPAPSDPMRLAAEVARLQCELAIMRARVVELESFAERDQLTRILNRRGFERELKRAAAYLKRYGGTAALIYLDLDDFKPINDRHGHAAGDAVLKAVAAALVGSVRASDSVARLGGDEFAVLLWNLSARDARAKAMALEEAVAAARIVWLGTQLTVRVSAGMAELGAGHEVADLMGSADAAMYVRKGERKQGQR